MVLSQFFTILLLIQSGTHPFFLTSHASGQSTTESLEGSNQAAVISPASTANSSSITSSHPSITQSILYGLLTTTIINLAALLGLVFSPLHKFSCYPVLISFMVATAVGSLYSTAILVLLPEALGLSTMTQDSESHGRHWYAVVSIAVCVGSFGFFVLEFLLRRMRVCLKRKSRTSQDSHRDFLRSAPCSILVPCDHGSHNGDAETSPPLPSSIVVNGTVDGRCQLRSKEIVARETFDSATSSLADNQSISVCDPNACRKMARLDPVVWMIVIGDGFHNFMDGLSIGAGFSKDLRLGISLAIPILCEELPHELGDIAILLRSGLAPGTAVLFNFTSACSAYIGFFLGIYLGEMSDAASYIFAITAGFFLYISLADMLPEMRKTEEECVRNHCSVIGLFSIHCLGLLFGFGCILLVLMLGDYIVI